MLIIAGGVLLIAGIIMTLAGGPGVGRLPGDIVVKRGNFTFFFPLMTSILLSIGITFILWLFRR